MVERQLLPSGTTVLQHGGIGGHEHRHLPHQRRQLKTSVLGTMVPKHGGICWHEHCHLPHQRRQLKTSFLVTTTLQHGGICRLEHCHLPHQRRQLKTSFARTLLQLATFVGINTVSCHTNYYSSRLPSPGPCTLLQVGGICGQPSPAKPNQRGQ
jgi:hypothetical protein